MGHLWDGLCTVYDALGFDEAAEGDELFRQLVLARIIEPTSKRDSLRVLAETGVGDGFREPGYSKERRLEPQITIGLLTEGSGFPLMAKAFEGNRAETTTMLPTIEAFMAAHKLADVTIVADAGMVSAANKKATQDAGLSFILGMKIPDIPMSCGSGAASTPTSKCPTG
jgi:hypothetical protein